MFPEYRELISQLKSTDHHFKTLFDRHNALDEKIRKMEARLEPGTREEIEDALAGLTDLVEPERLGHARRVIERFGAG